jgi:hypothetical protein
MHSPEPTGKKCIGNADTDYTEKNFSFIFALLKNKTKQKTNPQASGVQIAFILILLRQAI